MYSIQNCMVRAEARTRGMVGRETMSWKEVFGIWYSEDKQCKLENPALDSSCSTLLFFNSGRTLVG